MNVKPMKKKILIEDRNRELYDRIRKHYKVNLKKSLTESWGSNIEKNVVIISHSPTDHPVAAFTHELLHIETQLEGYKRIRAGVSLNTETQSNLPRLVDCIDNEFQHHKKMYDKFVSLGFSADEFYNDMDTKTISYLENVLSNVGNSFILLSVDYLTLIAPGGIIHNDKMEELKQLFCNYNNGMFSERFSIIDRIISDWVADKNYNAEKYIIQFFQNLDAGQTWITYDADSEDVSSNNFPSTGYFTDKSFTIEELAKAFNQ